LTTQQLPKVIFIIDGLDEFETDTMSFRELGALFANAAKSSHAKAVLSSRPINQLEDSLGTAQLHLHDLTKGDIAKYVSDKLKKNPRMVELSRKSPANANTLAQELVSSANCIFLWVRLVIESLLDGFDNHDSIEDLKRRLREIPQDLDMLFQNMITKIPGRYKTSWSRIVQLIQLGKEAGSGFPTALSLSFAHLDHAQVLAPQIKPLTPTELQSEVLETRDRLKAHTGGLIEVLPDDSNAPKGPWGPRVDYIHRSVAEFLQKNWKQHVEATQAPRFDATQTLLDCILIADQDGFVVPGQQARALVNQFERR
jgi:hypothetical protein